MKKAGPATAVEILGLTEVPEAGDEFNAVSSDKVAREIAEKQKTQTERTGDAEERRRYTRTVIQQVEQGDIKELESDH